VVCAQGAAACSAGPSPRITDPSAVPGWTRRLLGHAQPARFRYHRLLPPRTANHPLPSPRRRRTLLPARLVRSTLLLWTSRMSVFRREPQSSLLDPESPTARFYSVSSQQSARPRLQMFGILRRSRRSSPAPSFFLLKLTCAVNRRESTEISPRLCYAIFREKENDLYALAG
jgi:hypothetical protein